MGFNATPSFGGGGSAPPSGGSTGSGSSPPPSSGGTSGGSIPGGTSGGSIPGGTSGGSFTGGSIPGGTSGGSIPGGTSGGSIPGSTTGIPGSTTGIPGGTTGIPGGTTGIPGSTTGIPGSTTGIPGSTTGIPGSTTGIPGSTTGIPGSTTGIPGGTTGIPGSTTGIPGSTTGIPGSTTGIPGSTTGGTFPGGGATGGTFPGGGATGGNFPGGGSTVGSGGASGNTVFGFGPTKPIDFTAPTGTTVTNFNPAQFGQPTQTGSGQTAFSFNAPTPPTPGGVTVIDGSANTSLTQSAVSTVNFGGNFSDFQFKQVGGHFEVSSSQGTYEVANVTRMTMGSHTVAIGAEDPAMQTYRLYEAALGRAPDASGLNTNASALTDRAGMNLNGLANSFASSPEFQQKYGNLDNNGFVAQMYQNVLHRAADPSGLQNWMSYLQAGHSKGDLLVQFSESSENIKTIGTGLDMKTGQLLNPGAGASPTPPSAASFGGLLQAPTTAPQAIDFNVAGASNVINAAQAGTAQTMGSGLSNFQIAAAPPTGGGVEVIDGASVATQTIVSAVTFTKSFSSYSVTKVGNHFEVKGAEGTYEVANITRLTFSDQTVAVSTADPEMEVYRLYKAALGRTPDAQGLTSNTHALTDRSGMSVTNLANAFTSSAEFQQKYGSMDNTTFINQMYQNVLGRTPDAGGLQNWQSYLNAGNSKGAFLAQLSDSTENVNLVGVHTDVSVSNTAPTS